MTTGWIKLYRKIKEKGWYKDSHYVHLWAHLLMEANHTETEFLWNGNIIILKPGQLITSRSKLVVSTGIDRNKIERVLKVFENEHQIEQLKTNKYRLITVLNYIKHHPGEQPNEQQVSSQRAASEQQVSTYKNKENNKNKENDKKREYCPENSGHDKYLLKIPLKNHGDFFEVYQSYVDDLEKAFPGIENIMVQFEKYRLWAYEKQRNRKKPNGIKGSIRNWMDGAEERALKRKNMAEKELKLKASMNVGKSDKEPTHEVDYEAPEYHEYIDLWQRYRFKHDYPGEELSPEEIERLKELKKIVVKPIVPIPEL